MAEAIGVASGIVGLVSLTLSVSQTSYEYAQKVRKAPASISRYLQEILALSSTLIRLQETLDLPGVAPSLAGDNDVLPKSLIAECQKELEAVKHKLKQRDSAGPGFKAKLHSIAWPFEEKEIKGIVDSLARWNNIFSSIVATCNLRISNTTLTATQASQNESRRAVVLDWVYSDPSAIRNADIFTNYCADTCSWILNDEHCSRWLGEDMKTLFCHGGPGVGKTILTSFLINHLNTTSSGDAKVLYHYFDFRAEQRYHKTVAVVRHLLRQLLDNGDQLPKEVSSLYEKSLKTKTEPTEKVWIDLLCALIRPLSQVYILLDGFDESPDHTGLNRLFRRFKDTRTKTYVAGRPPIHLDVDFHSHYSLGILAPNEDLTTYIEYCLDEDGDLDALITDSLREELVAILTEGANGVKVFLYVKLALQSLTGCNTARQIRKALAALPKDLSSAHEATFNRILSSTPAKSALALKALAWMKFSERPLTMTELLHGLALERGDAGVDLENLTTPKAVLSSCLGFIEHREDVGLVQFAHATVEEYLEDNQLDRFDRFAPEIARSCITYLAQPAFVVEPCRSLEELATRLVDYPLLGYAALHWGTHASPHQSDLAVDISRFVRTPNAVANAAQAFHFLRRTKNSFSEADFSELPQAFRKMHLLALWGLKDIAVLETPTYAEITTPDSLGWTPLHWAAARGHVDMVNFLLSRGADIESKDLRQWTPLFWAAYWSRVDALRTLLDKGALMQAVDMEGNTPLHIAVHRGKSDICSALLGRGANWSVKSIRGSSPYDEALKSQVPEIARVFLELVEPRAVVANGTEILEESALERAVAWNPAAPNSVFRLTLEGETTAAECSDWPRPLLQRLTQYEHNLLGKDPARLTSIGSQLNHFGYSGLPTDLINQDDYVAGVLGYAILTERKEMVEALINVEVDLNKRWGRRWTRIYEEQFPVLLAAFVGNAELIGLLVSHGASVDVSDYEGRTPLHYAAMLGHLEATRVLCSHKQLLKSRDEQGKSPMHVVWTKLTRAYNTRGSGNSRDVVGISDTDLEKSFAIAEMLAQNGGDVDFPDHLGNTPLHDAVRTGSVEAVQKLLKLGADINIRANKNSDYWERKLDTRWEIRFGQGKEPNLDFQGDTPFTLACMNHELKIASALHLAGGVLPKDVNLRQPLIRAIADGDLNAVQTLFDFGTASQVAGSDADEIPLLVKAIRSLQWVMDRKSQGQSDFRRPFTNPQTSVDPLGAPEQYRSIIQFLLSVGQNPNGADDNGSTALLEALEYDYNVNIVDTLLHHGADPQISDKQGTTTLHVAAATGCSPFVQLLLSRKVNPNSASNDDNTPISRAAANGHQEIVQLLLEHPGFDATARGQYDWLRLSQCYNTIKAGDLERFRVISARPLPLSFVDRKGLTLLHLAADAGVEEMVSRLIDLGAEIKTQDALGNSSLHVAAASMNPSPAVMKALIDHGADIRARNYPGETYWIHREPQNATPLHLAAYSGNVALVEVLLDVAQDQQTRARKLSKSAEGTILPVTKALPPASSDSPSPREILRSQYINLGSDGCGRTALMCAVQSGNINTVKLLLERGASVNLSGGRGSWGFNALDLARPSRAESDTKHQDGTGKGEKSEMVNLLESHGAEVFDW